MSDLKTRFLTFCRQFEGVEDIDSLLKREHHALQLHVADFFFENRTIICEIKTLESETANKMLTFMAENGIDPELLQPGEHDVQNLFAQLTNGEALFRKATDLVMKPFADGLDEAQKQIRDTKNMFGIQSADGLLILLNDIVEIAGPPLIYKRLEERIQKTAPDGSPYHKDITQFLHIAERHVPAAPGDKLLNMTFPNPFTNEAHHVQAFVQKLNAAWATFNGQSFEMGGPECEDIIKSSKLTLTVKR